MRYKAIQSQKVKSTHSNGWWRAMREIDNDPECADMKYAHRLARLHDTMMDYDFHRDRIWGVNRRSWKSHTKCRHQWEKHEVPIFEYLSDYASMWHSNLYIDHNRKWVMECLHQKGTCIFNCHNDDLLYHVLKRLEDESVCTISDNLGNGYCEVTLVKQIPAAPHKKTSPGEKYAGRKYRCRKEQQKHKRERLTAQEAIAERNRRNRHRFDNGLAMQPLPEELLVPKKRPSTSQPPTPFETLCQAAIADRVKGITRKNKACLNLLKNFSLYHSTSKTHEGLASYEHNYLKFHNAFEQCCIWLTGRRPSDFPHWVIGFLTDSQQNRDEVTRIFNWSLGYTSARDTFGLTKNEARAIYHLPSYIQNESQAIVASIANTHHCPHSVTMALANQVPDLCNVNISRDRDFLRNLAEWLNTLALIPPADKLHDLLDFIFRSDLRNNPLFSFKGRSLSGMEQLMQQWHHQRQLSYTLKYGKKMKWDEHDYSYAEPPFFFQELTTGMELFAEGEAQHNCVFSYRHNCATGHTSIVSMQNCQGKEHLTIEINNLSRKIVQIRETCNGMPSVAEMRVVRRYASIKNLTIAC
jgi:hypothetical protein